MIDFVYDLLDSCIYLQFLQIPCLKTRAINVDDKFPGYLKAYKNLWDNFIDRFFVFDYLRSIIHLYKVVASRQELRKRGLLTRLVEG